MSTGDWEQPGGGQAADSGRRPAASGPQSVRQGLHEGLPCQSRRLHTAGPTASLLQGTCLLIEKLQTLKHKYNGLLKGRCSYMYVIYNIYRAVTHTCILRFCYSNKRECFVQWGFFLSCGGGCMVFLQRENKPEEESLRYLKQHKQKWW